MAGLPQLLTYITACFNDDVSFACMQKTSFKDILMSCHSSMEWKWEDPVTDELVEAIVQCCKDNKDYMKSEGYEGYTPTYMVMSMVDALILNCCNLLDGDHSLERIKKWSASAPDPIKAEEILSKVIAKVLT
jgi:hypothetical protein